MLVYMLGMFLWELFARQRPFDSLKTLDEVKSAIGEGKRPSKLDESKCPRQIMEIIEQCWNGEPTDRPFLDIIFNSLKKIQNELYPIRPDALYISLLVRKASVLFCHAKNYNLELMNFKNYAPLP